MKKMPELLDFGKWKEKNAPTFSLLDYIYGTMETKAVSPDIYVAFAQMYWPDFVEIDGLVFLAANYDAKYLSELKDQGVARNRIEYWMNLVCLDGIIEMPSVEKPDEFIGHTQYVASKLKEMWTAKVQQFSNDRTFQVAIVEDIDAGDLCITLYQGD